MTTLKALKDLTVANINQQIESYPSGSLWLVKPTRKLLISQLSKIQYGCLVISDESGLEVCGTERPNEPKAIIRVVKESMWERVVFGGTIGAAESYMDGDWTTDDLVSVVRVLCGNRAVMNGMEKGLALLKWPATKLWHFLRRDTIKQARRNIAAHYDLGDDFFRAWLDPTMCYSSGIFSHPNSTLLSASLRKIYDLCEKLELSPDDHLLEIGSGWGALAIFAASNYGCKVTTATISQNQFNHVCQEVKRLGLDHLVTPVFSDYRNLTGKFSKIVSVEMIEAVGHHFFDAYFRKIGELLEPSGTVAIQAITIRDQYYKQAIHNVEFIQRYIFPGSNIPSVTRMMESVRDQTDLILREMRDIAPHYRKTLNSWRAAFWRAESDIKRMGISPQVMRMWDFYFAYCEGGFAEKVIGVSQLIFTNPRYKEPSSV